MTIPLTSVRGAIVACILFACLAGCASEAVVEGVTQQEANRAAVTLDANGVSSDVQHDGPGAEGWSVWVDEALVSQARSVLVAHRLPADDEALPEALEGGLLGPSPQVEHTLLTRRQAAELAATLEHLDGVLDARVHLTLPFDPWRPEPSTTGEASVLLLERVESPASITDEEVAHLVAGAVQYLEPDAVRVLRLGASTEGSAGGPVVEQVGPWLVSREHAWELAASLVVLILIVVGLALFSGALLLRLRRTGNAD